MSVLRALKNAVAARRLPRAAVEERARDRQGLPQRDPGPAAVVYACLQWLARAQDCSARGDGGVARDFSLLRGWATSYPETTGYIVPTFIAAAADHPERDQIGRASCRERVCQYV